MFRTTDKFIVYQNDEIYEIYIPFSAFLHICVYACIMSS